MKVYCNKCDKELKVLNELENEELTESGSVVCSDCIKKEMEDLGTNLKIKNRQSYKNFERLYLQIKDKTLEEILIIIHNYVNNINGYGSRKNSLYAEESLNLFLKEMKGGKK